MYANLHEMYLHYDASVIKKICNVEDVSTNMFGNMNSRFSKHTIIKYSEFFPQMSASLADFLMGYFKKDKDQLLSGYTEYSAIRGNYGPCFDEYALSYLVELFSKDKNLKLKGHEVYYVDNDNFFMTLKELLSTYLEPFIKDKFFYQTNLIDLQVFLTRNEQQLLALLIKKQNG